MSRLGTRKSRAPSGVGLDRIGVSISRKPCVVEIIARRFRDAMAQAQVARELRAAQVEIAIREPQVFVDVLVVEREGEHVGLVQDAQLFDDDFDLAGRQIRIRLPGDARRDAAGDLDHILAAQRVRALA